jgi:hypothetical protein
LNASPLVPCGLKSAQYQKDNRIKEHEVSGTSSMHGGKAENAKEIPELEILNF